jgi:class 3 adenylate cyclase/PAS domain-containing protein
MSIQKTVLVVDDSNLMRRLVSEIVETDPELRVVDVAENGKIALQKVRMHKPDCILLDIEMPELSGLDTLRRLGLRSSSKIVILSSLGYEGSAERAEALRLGAADVIDKPSGSVSMDIKSARGSLINTTLRRVLGLPVSKEPAGEEIVTGEAAPAAPVDSLQHSHTLDSISTGVLTFDIGARLRYANAAASRLLGGRAFVPGVSGLDDIFDGFNEMLAEEVREVIATGEAKKAMPVDYATDKGDWTPFRVSIVPTPSGYSGATILIDDVSIEQSLRRVLDQTMSPTVTDAVIRGEGLGLGGALAEPTILFSDIRGFTSLCESLEASALVTLLNEYFAFMADVIRGQSGIIDKYIGDAIMALFGVPRSLPSNADSALSACLGMLEALDLFNGDRAKLGESPLGIGLGLASGPVIAGNIGSPDRKNYTVIGDAVNLASRLEGLTKAYGAKILICGNTQAALRKSYPSRRLDVVQVKGQNTATTLYEVFYQLPQALGTERWLELYANGLQHYEAGEFRESAAAFEKALKLQPSDHAAELLLERSRKLTAAPPADWRGVWRLDSKTG